MSKNNVSEQTQELSHDNSLEVKNVPELRFPEFVDKNNEKDWILIPVKEIFKSIPSKKHQIKKSQVLSEGIIPVIDQSNKSYIGFYDDSSKKFKDFPVICFGDHTTNIKILKNEFVIGCDGIKILKPKNNEDSIDFLYFNLLCNNIPQEGYKRHYSILKDVKIGLTSKEEQEKIANFLLLIDKKISLLEKKLDLSIKATNFIMKEYYTNITDRDILKISEIFDSSSSNLTMKDVKDNYGKYKLYGADGFIKNVDFYEIDQPYISIVKEGAGGVGRLNLHESHSSVLGTLQYLIPKKEFDLYYLFYYLKSINLRKYILVSTIPYILYKDLSKKELQIPPFYLQKKIGKLFNDFYKRNILIEKEIISLENYKNNLIKKLFI